MNSYLALTKTLITAIGMSSPQDKARKVKVGILAVFCVCGIFVPVVVGVGLFVHAASEILGPAGCGGIGVELMFHLITLFSAIFGINVIFSEFYFSNDIEYLLPWPLRASQIVGAKFTAVFFNENMIQVLLMISCVVGYGTAEGMGPSGWLLSLVGILTLPILPLAYCGIISILLMGMTRVIRSKDAIQKLSVGLVLLVLVFLVLSIGSLQDFDLTSYLWSLTTEEHGFLLVMNRIFPTVPLFVKTFTEGSVSALFGYLGCNLLAVAVMLALGELFYFRGVIGLSRTSKEESDKRAAAAVKAGRPHSPFVAYLLKEIRILLRTPTFFTNCVAVNFIWPIFVYAVYKIQRYQFTLAQFQQMYRDRNQKLILLMLLGIVGLSVLMTALSSISSNSISREGKHFSFMKYIPVSYLIQWNAKALTGIIFPAAGILVYWIPLCILLRVPLSHVLIYVLLCVLSVSFVAYLGIYIDSIQPKLIWDDELSSLRENFNTFFAMGIALVVMVVLCGGGYLLFYRWSPPFWVMVAILMAVLLEGNMLVMIISLKSGAKNIAEQEET
ncbi:MAG: hypothetical protein ACI4DO_03470 [Roseburia sp.]